MRLNLFFKLFLPNTKPIVVGIIYRPLSQSKFLEIINTHFGKIDIKSSEIYTPGGFSINFYLDNSCIFQKNNLLQCKSIPSDIKNTRISVQCFALNNW